MRLKRIFCALLVIIMIVSFAGCGSDTSTTPSDNTAPENTTPTDSNTSTPRKLIFEEFEPPVIEPFPYFHEEIAGVKRMFTTTCFNFDVVTMYSALQNSSFFGSSNGRNLQMKSGEDAAYYHPDFPMYTFVNGVYCELGGTEEKPDMTISVDAYHYTTYFTNPNAIRLTMTYNPEVEGYIGMIQDYPHEILNALIGWEFADFVVYGKDSDGLDYYLDEAIQPNNLSDNADAGNGGYTFLRTFEENKVIYEVFFYEDVMLGDQDLIGRPIESSTYELLPYKLDSIVSSGFGGTDPADIYTFGDKIFTSINPAYKTVRVTSVYHDKTITNNGFIYNIECVVEIPDTNNVLDLLVTYTVSEGKIINPDMMLYLAVDRSVNISEMTGDKLIEKATAADIDKIITIVKSLLPDSTITKVDTEEDMYQYQINYTLFDTTFSKVFNIYTSSEHVELTVLPNGVNPDSTHNHEHDHNH